MMELELEEGPVGEKAAVGLDQKMHARLRLSPIIERNSARRIKDMQRAWHESGVGMLFYGAGVHAMSKSKLTALVTLV
jgi:hypothetical protein